jgi:ribosomal protein L35
MKVVKNANKKFKSNAAGCGSGKVNSSHCSSKKTN